MSGRARVVALTIWLTCDLRIFGVTALEAIGLLPLSGLAMSALALLPF